MKDVRTGITKKYRLAGNDWYLVEEDNEKIMLVDTDCLPTDNAGIFDGDAVWSKDKSNNGQDLLNFANSLADKYFQNIKYAIIPRTVSCQNENGEGSGLLENAYMWIMSLDELREHRDIGGAIYRNSGEDFIWTRTFCKEHIFESSNRMNFAWAIGDENGKIYGACYSGSDVYESNHIALTFYLNKDMIERITEDGEIILKTGIQGSETYALERKKAERLAQLKDVIKTNNVLTNEKVGKMPSGNVLLDDFCDKDWVKIIIDDEYAWFICYRAFHDDTKKLNNITDDWYGWKAKIEDVSQILDEYIEISTGNL